MTASDNDQDKHERWLLDQTTKSAFFHQKLHEYELLKIAYALEEVRGEDLDWDLEMLRISQTAWNKIIHQGIKPVRAFAHPTILMHIDRSIGYYRGLAMVSRKSMNNIGLSIERFETGKNKRPLEKKKAQAVARRLNELISQLIESDKQVDPREFDLWRGMTAGSTTQGSWQNRKGDVAEELVKGLIRRRVRDRGLLEKANAERTEDILTDGRSIRYSSEPDIAIYGTGQKISAAVEIKGGIDPAAILERVGAAIKSLSRTKQTNPHALTLLIMYKISMSAQAQQDLASHQDAIDRWFTIEDVLNRESTRQEIYKLLDI